MSDGAILSRASFKSSNTPDSYSIVVIAPVEPGQKTVTNPSATDKCFKIESTWGVILIISQKPFVLSEMVFVINIMTHAKRWWNYPMHEVPWDSNTF